MPPSNSVSGGVQVYEMFHSTKTNMIRRRFQLQRKLDLYSNYILLLAKAP